MVKHVILWQLKDEIADCDREKVKADIKSSLEDLVGKVEGLITVKVYTKGLESSNADVMLYTELESEEALKGYAVHPDHVAAANTYVRPFTKLRVCMDTEE